MKKFKLILFDEEGNPEHEFTGNLGVVEAVAAEAPYNEPLMLSFEQLKMGGAVVTIKADGPIGIWSKSPLPAYAPAGYRKIP
jgi:hypothetical protein